MISNITNNLKLKELFRFVVAGGVSFIVEYGIFVLLTDEFNIYYLLSSGISFSISVILNYFICMKWVFENVKNQGVISGMMFIFVSITGLLINEFFMWFFVGTFLINYKFAKIITAIVVLFWNYFMKRKAILLKT